MESQKRWKYVLDTCLSLWKCRWRWRGRQNQKIRIDENNNCQKRKEKKITIIAIIMITIISCRTIAKFQRRRRRRTPGDATSEVCPRRPGFDFEPWFKEEKRKSYKLKVYLPNPNCGRVRFWEARALESLVSLACVPRRSLSKITSAFLFYSHSFRLFASSLFCSIRLENWTKLSRKCWLNRNWEKMTKLFSEKFNCGPSWRRPDSKRQTWTYTRAARGRHTIQKKR